MFHSNVGICSVVNGYNIKKIKHKPFVKTAQHKTCLVKLKADNIVNSFTNIDIDLHIIVRINLTNISKLNQLSTNIRIKQIYQ